MAHALFLLTIIFLSKHIPAPKLEPQTTATPVAITIIPPPPVALPPKPKPIFMTTPKQPNAPHKDALVQSDNDAKLASQTKKPRNPNSIMPDVESPDKHASSLQASQSAPPAKQQDAQTTPPSAKADPSKAPPTPPTPPTPPQPKTEPTKTPPQPEKVPPPPKPAPTPPKVPPPPELDENGLPVLAPLVASTITPQAPANQPQQQYTPPPMPNIVPANVQGMAGIEGQPSPAAMKTDLGMYIAKFYRAVGSRWYSQLDPMKIQTIGVGTVRIQYTITPEGIVSYKVLDRGGGSMQTLLTISILSIQGVSPFDPFPPSMLKDYPNGYTDDFTFSIY